MANPPCLPCQVPQDSRPSPAVASAFAGVQQRLLLIGGAQKRDDHRHGALFSLETGCAPLCIRALRARSAAHRARVCVCTCVCVYACVNASSWPIIPADRVTEAETARRQAAEAAEAALVRERRRALTLLPPPPETPVRHPNRVFERDIARLSRGCRTHAGGAARAQVEEGWEAECARGVLDEFLREMQAGVELSKVRPPRRCRGFASAYTALVATAVAVDGCSSTRSARRVPSSSGSTARSLRCFTRRARCRWLPCDRCGRQLACCPPLRARPRGAR